MRRLLITTGVLLATLLGALPASAKTIWLYRDGGRCPLEVPDDVEFYEVECQDIQEANRGVLCGTCPAGLAGNGFIGGTVVQRNADSPAAEHYGKEGDGFFLSDYKAQHLFKPGSWQEAEADYVGPRAWQIRLDQSTAQLNFDGQAFERSGLVYGLGAANVPTSTVRNRRFYDGHLRMGSMDGGVWRLGQTYYETGIGAGIEQANDVRHSRTSLGFRSVECRSLVDTTIFHGKYSSDSAMINNVYNGGRVRASYDFDPQLTGSTDASLTRIDVGLDNQTVTRSDAAGRLEWANHDGLNLAGEVRRVDEANDVVITSHLKGYTDIGGSASYRPDDRLSLSADFRHREAEAERIKLEDPGVFAFYGHVPPVQRSDLDALRVDTTASGNFLNLRGRYRFDDAWQLSADFRSTKWDSLPQVGKFTGGQSLEASYFADDHRNTSLRLSREFCGGGELVFDGSELRRNNTARASDFGIRRYSASYSAPLWDCQRYSLGLSRTQNSLDLTGTAQDWDSSSWSFDAGWSGEGDWANYRLNYSRQMLSGAQVGDYDSLALELQLQHSPLAITAWWRQRADGPAGAFTGFDDSGIRLGYAIPFD